MPDESYITTISLAELATGLRAAQNPSDRAQRQDRLQSVQTNLEALPFDASAARANGRVYALELAEGRQPRGARTIELLIAAIAVAENLTLSTRNPQDLANLQAFSILSLFDELESSRCNDRSSQPNRLCTCWLEEGGALLHLLHRPSLRLLSVTIARMAFTFRRFTNFRCRKSTNGIART